MYVHGPPNRTVVLLARAKVRVAAAEGPLALDGCPVRAQDAGAAAAGERSCVRCRATFQLTRWHHDRCVTNAWADQQALISSAYVIGPCPRCDVMCVPEGCRIILGYKLDARHGTMLYESRYVLLLIHSVGVLAALFRLAA